MAKYLPKRMEAVASHLRDYAGPAVTFQPVGEQRAPLHPTPGKIFVVDFAQIWCVPCLTELPQIAGVREDLRDRKDIEFVLVATDAKGDTPTRGTAPRWSPDGRTIYFTNCVEKDYGTDCEILSASVTPR